MSYSVRVYADSGVVGHVYMSVSDGNTTHFYGRYPQVDGLFSSAFVVPPALSGLTIGLNDAYALLQRAGSLSTLPVDGEVRRDFDGPIAQGGGGAHADVPLDHQLAITLSDAQGQALQARLEGLLRTTVVYDLNSASCVDLPREVLAEVGVNLDDYIHPSEMANAIEALNARQEALATALLQIKESLQSLMPEDWDADGNGIPDYIQRPQAVSDALGDNPDPLVRTIRYVPYDPLILDLDGDGLEITPLSGGVLFDANGDTVRTGTAWAGADDGLLVWDRNANGTIDNGAELFGDQTVLANGQRAAHGFEALRDLDAGSVVGGATVGAGDGVFDARDAQYANLRIWRDLNQDGISQANELTTLDQAGVQSIALGSTAVSTSYANGDATLTQTGAFTRADGSTGQAGSFVLGQNSFVREFAPITVSEAAQALPNIQGSGWVRDLQEAATRNPELIALFNAARNAPTRAEYIASVANLMREWGNESAYNSASEQALARGYGLIMSNPQDEQEAGWMDHAIKANEADRNVFRSTLSEADRTKFDAMRERMVGGLEQIYAYEAFTGHTFLDWSQILSDAINYTPRRNAPAGGRPVEVWVPFSEIIRDNRNAVMAGEGYIRVTIPLPPAGMAHAQTLWNRLVDDAVVNLMPALRLSPYLDLVDLSFGPEGIGYDFGRLNAALEGASTASTHEGAALFLDLHRSFGTMLDGLGWNGTEQLRALMQRAVTETEVRDAFSVTGSSFFAAGSTTGTATNDVFAGDAIGNSFNGGNGDDLIDGQAGNDSLTGGAGNDLIFGDLGNDYVYGGDGNDTLDGGIGDDRLYGDAGSDRLEGGTGNDYLSGEAGSDIYVFGRGAGQDTIYNYDTSAGRVDTIQMAEGVATSDVVVTRSSDDLILTIRGTTDSVRIQSYFNQDATGAYRVDAIRFADGTSWGVDTVKALVVVATSAADTLIGYATADVINGLDGNDTISGRAGDDALDGGAGNDYVYGEAGNDSVSGEAGNDYVYGGDGNDSLGGGVGDDRLYGDAGNDILNGGVGNDYLSGEAGSDTYVFGRGGGQDTIYNYDTSAGRSDSIQMAADVAASDIVVTRSSDDLILTIRGTTDSVRVQSYFNQDGAGSYRVDSIRFADGTSWGVDTVKVLAVLATSAADTLIGYATADAINGLEGNDTLSGRAGDDAIDGGAGNDYVYGEAGNDSVAGGAGADYLNAGDGNDTLYGGTEADNLYGEAGNDLLDGGAGNDYLSGGADSDTYFFGRGAGQDTIYNYDTSAGRSDAIQVAADVAVSDIVVTRSSDDLILTIRGTSDSVRVSSYFNQDGAGNYRLDAIRFSDGTVWNVDAVKVLAITATTGADSLTGYATADAIDGLDGNDYLYGRAGDDVMDGGAGNDYVGGEDGNDAVSGGAGADNVYGEGGNDTLDGGAGNDYLSGGAGSDIYVFARGSGQDTIYNYDTSVGRSDAIQLAPDLTSTDIAVTRSSDALILTIRGTTDSVRVQSYFNQDGAGSYRVDTIRFSDGTTWNVDAVKVLAITGTAAADTLTGYASADIIYGQDGNDYLYGRAGDDALDGGAGNDYVSGEDGNDAVNGGAGADTVYGDAGNDTLDGGAGNDYLSGGAGSDIYVFARGSGQDTIYNYDTSAGRSDAIQLAADLTSTDIAVTRSSDDLILTIRGTTDSVRIQSYFNQDGAGSYRVDAIRFADGTTWNVDAVKVLAITGTAAADSLTGYASADTINGQDGNDYLYGRAGGDTLDGGAGNDYVSGEDGNDAVNGGAGADTVYGDAGNDTLDGGAGNDYLSGGAGSDIYVFARGSGQDTIYNYDTSAGRSDTIQVAADLAVSDVVVTRSGDDLILTVSGTADSVRVQSYFYQDGTSSYRLDSIRFADGTVWNVDAIKAMTVSGTAGADTLLGSAAADSISGFDGNDYLYGRAGDDSLYGGAGADTLYGETGNDTLDGGAGNDYLSGDAGSDTYTFGRGSGQDTIYNYDTGAGRADAIQLASDLTTADIAITRSSDDLILTIRGTTDSVRVQSFFNQDGAGAYRVDAIRFADGTIWNVDAVKILAITGTTAVDTLTGYASADTINGLEGNDTLSGRAGNDLLDGGVGNDYVYGETGNDNVSGGAGADTVYGGDGNDVLDGGAGNDYLSGDAGSDTYIFGRGAGQDTIYNYDTSAGRSDTIQVAADVPVSDIIVTRSSDDLILTIRGTTDSVRVQSYFNQDGSGSYRVDAIRFADGTTWNIDAVKVLAITGTAVADTLTGYASVDIISGLDGNDTLSGRAGDDLLDGGIGNDYVYGETGNDNVSGGAGADTVYGGDGNDMLDGGTGNDYLSGDAGSDTYVFGRGTGQDTIYNYDTSAGRADAIQVAPDLTTSDIAVSRSSDDLIITIRGTTDSVRVQSYFNQDGAGSYRVDTIRFADGTAWNVEAVKALSITGSSAAETLVGFGSADAINGLEGNDYLYGRSGDDSLNGGAGADTVYGEVGNDTMDGGAGNDYLSGDAGSDTYLFGRGAGQDTIYNYDTSAGRSDTIQTASDLGTSDIAVTRQSDDLILSIRGTTDSVRVQSYFNQDGAGSYRVDAIRFADGTVWNVDAVKALSISGSAAAETLVGFGSADTINGLDGNDYLYGRAGDDTLFGGAAADTLYGEAGNDTLDGGTGNDYLSGDAGSDTYAFGRGAGQDTIYNYDTSAGRSDTIQMAADLTTADIAVSRSSDDLTLTIRGTTDSVRVQSYFNQDGAGPYRVDAIRFADGTMWNVDAVKALSIAGSAAAETLVGFGAADTISGLDGADYLYGRAGDDILYGGAGADTLYGETGNDTLHGGAGNDYLSGDAGSDTYAFGRGAGQDTIYNYDTSAGSIDTLMLGSDIAIDQVWLRRNGSSLEISVIGTGDTTVVQSWYSSSNYQLDQIRTADGHTLLGSQVDALVSAMASFAPPPPGQTTLPQNYRDQLAPTITANWQ